jgi:exopolysaccharide biosynthesis polyprenyl glycosylphosphotransferase
MVTLQPNGIDESVGLALSRVRPRPNPHLYAGWHSGLLLASDALVFVLAGIASLILTHTDAAAFTQRADVVLALVFAAAVVLMIYDRLGLYRRSFGSSPRDELYASFAGSLLGLIPPALLLVMLPGLAPYRHQLAIAVGLSAVGLSVSRVGLSLLRDRIAPARPRRIAVAGTPQRVDALPGQLSLRLADAVLRIPLERFDAELDEVAAHGDVSRLSWLTQAAAWECDTLLLTEALPPELMTGILRVCEANGIRLAFAQMRLRPHSYDLEVRRDGGVALLYPQQLAVCTPGADLLRRTFDLALTVPALVLLSPLLIAIAVGVAVDSGRPVFFRQTRVGRFGKTFEILKFRTMRVDAEAESGPTWAQPGETRVTRFGRWLRRTSLDELPQLINVLRGEMSLIGPRPERPFYVERFRTLVPRYEERHLVRPGITGWAQVNMRRILDPSAAGEKLSYDLFYLEHWSLFLDATILLKTAAEFLFHEAG